MTRIIKLINSKNGWLAKFECDEEVLKAFGTGTIPTPFRESTSPMFVKAEIEKRNPNHYVTFA